MDTQAVVDDRNEADRVQTVNWHDDSPMPPNMNSTYCQTGKFLMFVFSHKRC